MRRKSKAVKEDLVVSELHVIEEYNDMYLGTFMPSKEYYSQRLNRTLVVSVQAVEDGKKIAEQTVEQFDSTKEAGLWTQF